ncbi:MAG TPA: succinate dehydrogenase, cytochrome b556 subunit [Bellilinea sp.]|nr:succinate dehydrogenase, cytochrome b556 subunit [Bellilinea sp.]
MNENPVTPGNFHRWFGPYGKSLPGWMYTLNRLCGLGLVLYLILHLTALFQLSQGAAGYNGFLALVHHPIFKAGEVLVIAACLLHGLNGLRIVLTSLGIGLSQHRAFAWIILAISVILTAIFAIQIFK